MFNQAKNITKYKHRTAIQNLHLYVVSLLLFCLIAETADFIPQTSELQQIRKKLAMLSAYYPTPPAQKEMLDEWNNMQFYLLKARFLISNYKDNPQLELLLSNELEKIQQSINNLQKQLSADAISGFREECYYSNNDGSYQPYIRYVPKNANTKQKKFPLIVFLHCYSPSLNIINWQYIPQSLLEFVVKNDFCFVAPFGRSNTDFQGIGEQDVLIAISEMKRRYPIDEERIVLCGISMGGMGVWTIGAHYPDIFAGLVVVAGRGDYYFWHKISKDNMPLYKRILIDADFGYSLLPNLAKTPILCAHGALDSLVSVQEGRYMISALKKINHDVTYIELPEGDHWIYDDIFSRKDVHDWIKDRKRSIPTEFEYISYLPRYTGCYGIYATHIKRLTFPMRIKVNKELSGLINLQTSGIHSIMVKTNFLHASAYKQPSDVHLVIYTNTVHNVNTLQPHIISGPIREAFLSPFIFVNATTLHTGRPSIAFRKAIINWYEYSKAFPRTSNETDILPATLAEYNIFLFGEPESSKLISTVLQNTPIKVTTDSYIINNTPYPRKNNGLYFIYPNPWNTNKLVIIQCGIPWGDGLPSNHKYDYLPDYIVYTSNNDTDGSNAALCAGFFDENWQITDKLMYVKK